MRKILYIGLVVVSVFALLALFQNKKRASEIESLPIPEKQDQEVVVESRWKQEELDIFWQWCETNKSLCERCGLDPDSCKG